MAWEGGPALSGDTAPSLARHGCLSRAYAGASLGKCRRLGLIACPPPTKGRKRGGEPCRRWHRALESMTVVRASEFSHVRWVLRVTRISVLAKDRGVLELKLDRHQVPAGSGVRGQGCVLLCSGSRAVGPTGAGTSFSRYGWVGTETPNLRLWQHVASCRVPGPLLGGRGARTCSTAVGVPGWKARRGNTSQTCRRKAGLSGVALEGGSWGPPCSEAATQASVGDRDTGLSGMCVGWAARALDTGQCGLAPTVPRPKERGCLKAAQPSGHWPEQL